MKTLFIIPSYYPAVKYGGPIFSTHLLNQTLVKKGIEIYVLTTNAGLENDKNILLNKWMDSDGVKVKYLPYCLSERLAFPPTILFEIIREIKKVDLVHITGIWGYMSVIGALVSKLKRKPYIISPHGMLHRNALKNRSYIFKKLYLKLFSKLLLSDANIVHCTTNDEKENIILTMGKKLKLAVVSNGIDLSEINSYSIKSSSEFFPFLEGKKYLLYLGRICPGKGIELLISAFSEVLAKNPDLCLVIAGPEKPDYRKYLDEIIDSLNLNNKVFFTEMLLNNSKISAYKNAEAFILSSYFENFSMSSVEAMACGVPTLISNKVGIYKEVLEYDAGLVTNLDVNDIRNKIIKILTDSELKNKLVKNAKKLVEEKYEISKAGDQMIEIYESIILK